MFTIADIIAVFDASDCPVATKWAFEQLDAHALVADAHRLLKHREVRGDRRCDTERMMVAAKAVSK